MQMTHQNTTDIMKPSTIGAELVPERYAIDVRSKLDHTLRRYSVILKNVNDHNWISDRILGDSGFPSLLTASPEYLNFRDKILKSRGIVDLTWFCEKGRKARRTRFYVVSTKHFDVLFGGNFLKNGGLSIFSK